MKLSQFLTWGAALLGVNAGVNTSRVHTLHHQTHHTPAVPTKTPAGRHFRTGHPTSPTGHLRPASLLAESVKRHYENKSYETEVSIHLQVRGRRCKIVKCSDLKYN